MKVKKIVKKKSIKKKKEIETSSSTEFTLPTERTQPCDSLQDYSILLYGEKKIGKTTLTSMFKKAFFMLCEPGGKALSLYSRPVRNWLEFKAYVRLIVKSKEFENSTAHYSNVITQLIEDYTNGELPSDYYKKLNAELKKENR